MSKAFDKVWHKGIVHKLKCKGVSCSNIRWFESYLEGRQQRVVIDGSFSDYQPVKAGVPQGSILAPLIFLVQIDDISQNIISDVHLFVDDIIIIQYVDDPVISANILNSDLSLLLSWTLKWLMLFNVLKCVVLNISLKRKALTHPPLTLNGFDLEQVSFYRHIGLIFNCSFTWNDHIEHLCQKAGKLINMMKYLKYTFLCEALEKIYPLPLT